MPRDDDRSRDEFTGEAEELLEALSRDLADFEAQGTNVRPELINKIFRARIEFVQPEHPNSVLNQLWTNLLIPAAVLFFDKLMSLAIQQVPLPRQRQPFRAYFIEAVFELLDQPRHTHFEELIQVTGSN